MLWIFFILGVLGALVNGPVFRWGGKKAILKAFGQAGLSGDLTFEGTILGGPVLSDARFTGEERLREIAFARASVAYSLGAALQRDWPKVVETITFESPRIVIDESRPAKAKKESKSDDTKTPFDPWSLTAYRNVEILVKALDFEMLRRDGSGTPEWKIDDATLSLVDGGEGTLRIGSLFFPDGHSYSNLSARLGIKPDSLTLVGPRLDEQIAVESLSLGKPDGASTGIFDVDARLRVFGGVVKATHAEGSATIAATLTEGTVDLASATAMFGLKGMDSGTLEKLDATIVFSPRPADGSKTPPPAIGGNLRVSRFSGYKLPLTIDTASADVRFAERSLTVENLSLDCEGNRLTGSIAAGHPDKGEGAKGWLDALEASLAFDGPQASSLLAAYELPVEAKAAFEIDLAFEGGSLVRLGGDIRATDVAYGDASAGSLRLGLSLDAPDVVRADLAAEIDKMKSNTANLGGSFDLGTRDYSAKLDLALGDLEKLLPVAAELGAGDLTLGGDVGLHWEGSGTLDPNRPPGHQGEATLAPSTFSVNGGTPITASLTSRYAPGSVEVEQLAATVGDLAIEGALAWDGSRLGLTGLRVLRAGTELARADASLPLTKESLGSPETLFSQEGTLSLNAKSVALPLGEIFKALNQESKAGGLLNADISASGTYADPAFRGSVDIDRLSLEGLDNLKSGNLHLGLRIAGNQAAVDGSLTHPDINPVTIRARAPFNPRMWIENPDSLQSSGIEASLSLPENPLAVIQPFIPDASAVEGTFSILANLSGTLATPEISGSLRVASPLISFRRQDHPSIRNTEIDLRLAGQTLAIQTFKAEIAGGPLSFGGSIGLADLKNPALEITARAREILVARDNDLSIRANADLTLTGPYQAAKLGGRIGITESRYLRNIEILPIGILRPAAAPAARRVAFTPPAEPSIATEPFAHWSLDVIVGTDNPFLVRGNLAHADIEGQIHVTGTGAAPVPDGTLRITEGEATFPFSKLSVTDSSVIFHPGTGFLAPQLNILGTARMRSFRITLRLYGTATNPKYLLTSSPPLPQEDILSLIATGATRSELNESNVLASRAAILLLERIGNRIKTLTGADPSGLPLSDRLDFEITGTDPRTGKTASTTTFRLTDNIHIVGAVNQNGDYRGLLKFIVRLD